MTFPTFTNGQVLPASDLNAIGLWLVKSQAVGSGVSSVTVTGAFTADYDNYKIIYSNGVGSVTHNLRIALGSATTGYYGAGLYSPPSPASANAIGDNNAARFSYVGGGDQYSAMMDIDLISPYANTLTSIQGTINTGSNFGTYTGRHYPATSFTSFIISPDGGTLTGGTIYVYGYRK
jgi:hypothetical protein